MIDSIFAFLYILIVIYFINMSKVNGRYPVLDNLLGSKTKVKMLKFLFRNYPVDIGLRELARRIQEPLNLVRKEIKNFEKMGLVKKS